MLFADHWAHRGAEEHRVHLEPRVLERALDDVERHRVDLDVGRHLGDPQLSGLCHCHRDASQSFGVIRTLKLESTLAEYPGRTTVVESNSVTIAGPANDMPGRSFARS